MKYLLCLAAMLACLFFLLPAGANASCACGPAAAVSVCSPAACATAPAACAPAASCHEAAAKAPLRSGLRKLGKGVLRVVTAPVRLLIHKR